MIDLNKASRLEFWPSREWLARKLSNPNRDRELWDCAAKLKSSWKTTVYSFIRERCDRLGSLFHWRLYHIEVLQRLSRTYLPGDSQNDPLVLLIFCAKSSSDDIGRRGVRMQRSMDMVRRPRPMQGHGRFPSPHRSPSSDRDYRILDGGGMRGRFRERYRPFPSPPRSPSSDRDCRIITIGGGIRERPRARYRERPRERYRPFPSPPRSPSSDRDARIVTISSDIQGRARGRYRSDDSSSIFIDDRERGRRSIPPKFERLRPRRVSETKQSDAEMIEIIDSDDNFEYYAPQRHRMGNEINKRVSETKQSDAEISDSDDHFEYYAPRRHTKGYEIDSDDHFEYYAPRRHTKGNKINKRVSETKQSDAEIIDQILREYTTYGDSNANPTTVSSAPLLTTTNDEPAATSSPIEQASMNGRANAADGTSDAS